MKTNRHRNEEARKMDSMTATTVVRRAAVAASTVRAWWGKRNDYYTHLAAMCGEEGGREVTNGSVVVGFAICAALLGAMVLAPSIIGNI